MDIRYLARYSSYPSISGYVTRVATVDPYSCTVPAAVVVATVRSYC